MLQFMEPEYALARLAERHPPVCSALAEQYSVAALLYFLFTGFDYLDFSVEKQAMQRQVAEDAPLPFTRRGQVPRPELEKALARALSKDPALRYPSLRDFAEALSQAGPVPEPDHPGTDHPETDAPEPDQEAAGPSTPQPWTNSPHGLLAKVLD